MTVSKLIHDIQANMEAKLLMFACLRLECNPNDGDVDMSAIMACMNDTFGRVVREHYVSHYRWDIIQPYMLLNKELFSSCSESAIIECIRQYLIYMQVVENKF